MATVHSALLEDSGRHSSIRFFYLLGLISIQAFSLKKFVNATWNPVPKTWAGGAYPSNTSRKPVTSVNWDDASAYASLVRSSREDYNGFCLTRD